MNESIDDVYGSGELLKASDLQGHEPTVIIEAVERRDFQDGNKLVISFQGKTKKLICNKTNAKRIAMLYGDKYMAWVGHAIKLYTDIVDFQGRMVEAIRVRPPAQQANGKTKQAVASPQLKHQIEQKQGYTTMTGARPISETVAVGETTDDIPW